MKNQIFKQAVTFVSALVLVVFTAFPVGAQSTTATLFFDPSTKTAALNQNFSIDIRVNTASQDVVGVDSVFIYDPTYLGAPTVDTNSGIPSGIILNMGNQGTTADGKIKYDVSWLAQYNGGATMNSATGRVATITFKALKVGSTTLTFSQADSTISDASGNDLIAATGHGSAAITISEGTPTPPTPTPPFQPGQTTTGPFISSITPSSGPKNAVQQVVINGGNFANYQTDKSKAYVGLNEVTVLDWNLTRIVAQFPANEMITRPVTLTVRVLTSEDKEANYLGYTYTLAGLPSSGPEVWMWGSVALAALALSWLTYRRFNYSSNRIISSSLANEDEDMPYRF